MSVQAISWVLEEAPDLPAHLVSTLLALANRAGPDGRGAFPGQAEIAWYTRKEKRNARKDIDALEKLGLIRPGDQRLAAYIRSDRRPMVWDLAMERKRPSRTFDEGTQTSPRKAERGDAHVPSQNGRIGHGGMQASSTGGRVHPPNRPLNQEASSSSSPNPIARIAAALGLEEEEAQIIYNRVLTERSPGAPSRYIDALIASGDIAQFRTSIKPAAPAAATHPYQDSGRGYCAKCHMPEKHARHGGRK